MSTFTNCTCGRRRAASANAGAIILHGPHQSAQKSATTGSAVPAANAGRSSPRIATGAPGSSGWWQFPQFGTVAHAIVRNAVLREAMRAGDLHHERSMRCRTTDARRVPHFVICGRRARVQAARSARDRRSPVRALPFGDTRIRAKIVLHIVNARPIMTSSYEREGAGGDMLNFNRRDRIGEPAEPAKTALKPAIYDPPAAGAQAAPAKAPAPHAAEPRRRARRRRPLPRARRPRRRKAPTRRRAGSSSACTSS